MEKIRITILLLALTIAGVQCKPPLTSGTTPQSYIRLLDADPPTGSVVMRTSTDGNILFLYTAKVPGDSVTSIELTKTDVNGNVLWTQHYPAASTDNYAAGDCLSLTNGSIAVAATHFLPDTGTNSKNTNHAFTLLLVDGNGNLTLSRDYEPETNLTVVSIRQSDDGDFIIGGDAKDAPNPGSLEVAFIRLSDIGDFLGFDSPGAAMSMQYAMNDMSAISGGSGGIVGTYYSGSHPNPAFYLWQSDSIAYVGANTKWTGQPRSIARTGAASYVIAGDSAVFNVPPIPTPWIAEVDNPIPGTSLTTTWSRGIKVDSSGSIACIIHTADGGLAATGYAASASHDTEIIVFRFDAKGNDVWPYKTYYYAGGDIPNNIIELPNGDLIVGGVTTSFGARSSGSRQIFLLHLKADGTPAS